MENIVKSIITIKKCIKDAKDESLRSALNDAFKAMKKQIPKDAVEVEKNYYMCPRCNYEFPDVGGVSEYYGESEKYSYCPECGQAICYKEENDA